MSSVLAHVLRWEEMSVAISRASRAVPLHQIELPHQFSDSPKLTMSHNMLQISLSRSAFCNEN
jgi:hypothetical protein